VLIGSLETTITILFGVIALGPIVAERLKIPGIIGLIAGGVVFGPYVLDWLQSGGLVTELGSIGILYLMFLAGLSFDIKAFSANRRAAIAYGLLGFAFPFFLSVFVVSHFDEISGLGALLIGSMWASNTLVAYSEVQAAGLQKTRSVGAAVSAGVVADLLSLTVMAFATASAVIEADLPDIPILSDLAGDFDLNLTPSTPDPPLPLWLGLPLLAGFCLWVLPRVATWFFVNVGRTRPQRVVFTLALMGAGAMVATLGGMEGLIGAFLAGLGLNSQVPARGPLMERLDFMGTTVFVPMFLVSIGLNIDPVLLLDGATVKLAILFTLFVLVGKTASALLTGAIFKYSRDEIGLMSTLSYGQAASTLAIAEVGSGLDMFGQTVVNAAVITIVITALITSYGTRYFARKVPPPDIDQPPIGEQILLDTRANGSDPAVLTALAGAVARVDGGVVRPFAISSGSDQAAAHSITEAATAAASAIGLDADGVVRVDDSFADATVNLVAELEASLVILDWSGPSWTDDYLFGNDVDEVGGASSVPVAAVHVVRPWERVVVVLGAPDTAWEATDSELAARMGLALRRERELPLLVQSRDAEFAATVLGADLPPDKLTLIESTAEVTGALTETDLVIAPAHVLGSLPPWRARRLVQEFADANVIVVAGPYRLAITQGPTRRAFSNTIVHPAIAD